MGRGKVGWSRSQGGRGWINLRRERGGGGAGVRVGGALLEAELELEGSVMRDGRGGAFWGRA